MEDGGASVCIGAGWLGCALSKELGVQPVPRRDFTPGRLPEGSVVFVASCRSAIKAPTELATALRTELDHLRRVLDACNATNARRIVVLGSSDVAGATSPITGSSPHSPQTRYAEVKAAIEDECRLRSLGGMPVTVVRLAPVHGPGKERTSALLRVTRRRVLPILGDGSHSIGFVLLDDALRALAYLGREPSPPVVAVGGGPTPLRELLGHLATAQGNRPRWVRIPAPASALHRLVEVRNLPDWAHWLLRISQPRSVEMEVPVPVTSLPDAAARLVATCSS